MPGGGERKGIDRHLGRFGRHGQVTLPVTAFVLMLRLLVAAPFFIPYGEIKANRLCCPLGSKDEITLMVCSGPMRSLTLVVKFDRGLARRHRLPFDHVMNALREVRMMIEEAGIALQREKGIEKPTGDFGLELVGGFVKGSFQVNIALTRDIRTARAAAQEIIQTVDWLASMDGRPDEVKQPDEIANKIVRRLNRIADIQRTDKTEMRLELKNGRKRLENLRRSRYRFHGSFARSSVRDGGRNSLWQTL